MILTAIHRISTKRRPDEGNEQMAQQVDVNGVLTWYDEEGSGPPVVLLHGGLTDSRDFQGNLEALARHHHVYLPERRGHGHTPDVAGPLTIESMGRDTAAFLTDVVGEPAHLVGYSAGAKVALHVAVHHPGLVRRLVVISGAFHPDGMTIKPEAGGTPPAPLLEAYAEVSPDGAAHFPEVLAKVAEAANQPFGINEAALGRLECPTMVIAGDRDIVSIEHTTTMYRALQDARLAVVPNASHLLLHEHPGQVTALVQDFLDEAPHNH